VGVLVEGSRLQLLLDDLVRRDSGYVELDLGETFAGLFETRLSPLDVRSNGRPVSIVSPSSVSFMIYRRAEKRVPVRLSVEGQLPQGFTMVGRPEISPPEVTVSGPSTLVEHLDHVTTEPLRLGRRRQGFVERVPLASPDPDVRLRPVEVEVAAAVDEIVERAFANVPLSILADTDTERLHVDPTVAQVRVLGAAGAVAALGPQDVSLVLHIGDLEPGVYQLEPEVVVPDGVISSTVDPPSFQVIVEGLTLDGDSGP
jgi:YbbR domain-containing protein